MEMALNNLLNFHLFCQKLTVSIRKAYYDP
jgi:hypothetical protein